MRVRCQVRRLQRALSLGLWLAEVRIIPDRAPCLQRRRSRRRSGWRRSERGPRPAEERQELGEHHRGGPPDLVGAQQKRWKVGDRIRWLPILDGFAPPVKIYQTFHDDLPIDYGGFRYVTRFDRCTTCHLGMDKPTYDKPVLSKLKDDPTQDTQLQTNLANAVLAMVDRQRAKDGKEPLDEKESEKLREQVRIRYLLNNSRSLTTDNAIPGVRAMVTPGKSNLAVSGN